MGRFFTEELQRRINAKALAALDALPGDASDGDAVSAVTAEYMAAIGDRTLELHDEHAATIKALAKRIEQLEQAQGVNGTGELVAQGINALHQLARRRS